MCWDDGNLDTLLKSVFTVLTVRIEIELPGLVEVGELNPLGFFKID